MQIQNVIEDFDKTGEIPVEFIKRLLEAGAEKKQTSKYFILNRNRAFALTLLKELIELRKDGENEVYIEDLMFASYLVGIHGFVEDSLLIWAAKQADFDTYCGMDGELIAFAGYENTISYLNTCNAKEAANALGYVLDFEKEDLINYFSKTGEM